MKIPESFTIIRTKSQGLHFVTDKLGVQLLKRWLSPVADAVVALSFTELTGAVVSVETSQIESFKSVDALSIANEIRLNRRAFGEVDPGERWMIEDEDEDDEA